MNDVPLTPPVDSVFERFDLAEMARHGIDVPAPDLLGILYPQAINAVIGEPGLGKSFLAVAACVKQIRRERKVIVLDFEDSPATWIDRFFCLGLRSADLAGIEYLRPLTMPCDADLAWLGRLVTAFGDPLVVVDSVPEALSMAGLDENAATDVSRWFQLLPRPLARAGAMVLVVDHVTKATENRGRWARGSGAKLAAIDGAAYTLETVEPFSRQRSGISTLRVGKDRHGQVGGTREPVRSIHFDVAGGSVHTIRFESYAEAVAQDAPSAPDYIEPWLVADTLRASGGTWSSHKQAARALGCSTNAVGVILGDAVVLGAIVVEGQGSRLTYSLPVVEGMER